MFEDEYLKFWQEFGESKKMVLSTSLNDIVTSRMMSMVVLDKKIYFQTDRTFRKYSQLKGNPNVSLCIDNIQMEGYCEEIGKPDEDIEFSNAYQKHFPSSYMRYTVLESERLFVVRPMFIERWLYIDKIPYVEIFDVTNKQYSLKPYMGI